MVGQITASSNAKFDLTPGVYFIASGSKSKESQITALKLTR